MYIMILGGDVYTNLGLRQTVHFLAITNTLNHTGIKF